MSGSAPRCIIHCVSSAHKLDSRARLVMLETSNLYKFCLKHDLQGYLRDATFELPSHAIPMVAKGKREGGGGGGGVRGDGVRRVGSTFTKIMGE